MVQSTQSVSWPKRDGIYSFLRHLGPFGCIKTAIFSENANSSKTRFQEKNILTLPQTRVWRIFGYSNIFEYFPVRIFIRIIFVSFLWCEYIRIFICIVFLYEYIRIFVRIVFFRYEYIRIFVCIEISYSSHYVLKPSLTQQITPMGPFN